MAPSKEVPYSEFGKKLTTLRRDAGMTRAELGDICGVAQSTIVNYERGTRIPYADTAVKIADYFHITVHELLCVENEELAMAQAEAMDQMRAINGKKGADRLQEMYQEAAHLAGGDLSDDQLLEFSLEMTKAAQIAQQRLNERFTNKRYQSTVEAKAEQTAAAVKAIDEKIISLTSGKD